MRRQDDDLQELLDDIRAVSEHDHLPRGLSGPDKDARPEKRREGEHVSTEPGNMAAPHAPARNNHQVARAVTRPLSKDLGKQSTARVSTVLVRELRNMAIFSRATTPEMAHRSELVKSVEFAYATANMQLQSHSEGWKVIKIPNANQGRCDSRRQMSGRPRQTRIWRPLNRIRYTFWHLQRRCRKD